MNQMKCLPWRFGLYFGLWVERSTELGRLESFDVDGANPYTSTAVNTSFHVQVQRDSELPELLDVQERADNVAAELVIDQDLMSEPTPTHMALYLPNVLPIFWRVLVVVQAEHFDESSCGERRFEGRTTQREVEATSQDRVTGVSCGRMVYCGTRDSPSRHTFLLLFD